MQEPCFTPFFAIVSCVSEWPIKLTIAGRTLWALTLIFHSTRSLREEHVRYWVDTYLLVSGPQNREMSHWVEIMESDTRNRSNTPNSLQNWGSFCTLSLNASSAFFEYLYYFIFKLTSIWSIWSSSWFKTEKWVHFYLFTWVNGYLVITTPLHFS